MATDKVAYRLDIADEDLGVAEDRWSPLYNDMMGSVVAVQYTIKVEK